MPNTESRSTKRRVRSMPVRRLAAGGGAQEAARPAWQWLAAVLIPLAAVVLAGGTTRWSQAVILVAVGLLLALVPPRVSAGRTIHLVLAGLLVLAAAAFLPAKWFFEPAWRTALVEDFEVPLAWTLSPQPALAIESLALFLAGMAWFYLMLTFQWKSVERLRAGRVFAGGVVVLAGLFLVLHRFDLVPPIWHNERHYGPFPNRNQTADFLGVGGIVVLACAQLRWNSGNRLEAAGWLLGLSVVTVSLFSSYSRAGVVLLFTEVAVYLLVEARRALGQHAPVETTPASTSVSQPAGRAPLGRGLRWAALSFSLVLLLSTLVLLFGGSTMERLRPDSLRATGGALTGDFRVKIQSDALHLISASPWVGVGLGSFSEVFALFRRQSASPARAIHPESDYLWAGSELGWPALLFIGVGVGWLAWRVGRSVQVSGAGRDRRLRLAAGLGAAAFAFHGFADVSGHRLGTVLSAVFLLGLAVKVPAVDRDDAAAGIVARLLRSPQADLRGWPVAAFRLLGVLLVAVGGLWLAEARGYLLLPGQIGADWLREQAKQEIASRDYQGAEADLTRALAWAPLDWNLYLLRAQSRLYLGGDRDATAEDFRRARYLEPFLGALPAKEALLWELAGEQKPAVSALGEACRREPRQADAYLSAVMSAGKGDKTLLDELARYTRRDPALMLIFLQNGEAAETTPAVQRVLLDDPELTRLDDAQKKRFFQTWALSGDRAAFLSAMPLHPAWQVVGWRWWAVAAADTGDLKLACALAKRWTSRPTLPEVTPGGTPPGELLRRALLRPANPMSVLQCYRVASDAGDWRNARLCLDQITSQRDCPPYFHYLKALACQETDQWKTGWEAWQHYFTAAGI